MRLKFTFVTLFPNLIEPYFQDSILKRAVESGFINYEFYNPRDYHTVGFSGNKNCVPKTEEEIHAEYLNGYGRQGQ